LILEAYANEDFKNTLLKEICQNKDNFISLFKLHYLHNISDVKKWNQHKLKSYILEKIWIVEQIEILLKLKKSEHILFDFLNTAFIYNMYQLDYELAKEINSSFFEEEFTLVPENLKVEINNLIDILSSEESKIRVLIKNKYWNDYLKWKFEDKFSLILSQSESELHTLKTRKQERLLDIANFKTSIGVEKYNEFILDIERNFFLKKQEIEFEHLQRIKDFTIAVLQVNDCE